MISSDEILTAVFKILDADSTLQGSAYLNGNDKIEKSPQRRKGISNPSVIMKMGGAGIDTENKLQTALIYITTFVDDLNNGVSNTQKLSKIQKRIESLLDDISITITGGRVFNCYLTNPHSGVYWDSKIPDEHFVTSAFRLQYIDLS